MLRSTGAIRQFPSSRPCAFLRFGQFLQRGLLLQHFLLINFPVDKKAQVALGFVISVLNRQAQCLGDTGTVGRVGLAAVADMAALDFLRRITHATGGVVEQHLLLGRCH